MIMNATIEFALKDGKMVLPQSAQRSQKKKRGGVILSVVSVRSVAKELLYTSSS